MKQSENLVMVYVYLAAGSGFLGIIITFLGIIICQYFNIIIEKNLWVLAVPVVTAVLLNVLLIELYRKLKHIAS